MSEKRMGTTKNTLCPLLSLLEWQKQCCRALSRLMRTGNARVIMTVMVVMVLMAAVSTVNCC